MMLRHKFLATCFLARPLAVAQRQHPQASAARPALARRLAEGKQQAQQQALAVLPALALLPQQAALRLFRSEWLALRMLGLRFVSAQG